MRSILIFCFFIAYSAVNAQPVVSKDILAVLSDIDKYHTEAWKNDSTRKQPLRSQSEESFIKRYTFLKATEAKLNSLNKDSLSFDDRINLELLLHDIHDTIAQYEFKSYLNPILSDYGFHTSIVSYSNTVLNSPKEARNYINILQDIPRYVDENIHLMRRGLSLGISQPGIIISGYESTYKNHLVDTVEQSSFWKPFTVRPVSINEPDWLMLQSEARTAIKNDVIPSYQKIKTFFEKEYLSKTRKTLGASNFPQGKAFYEDRVRHYTTTNLSSEEVYQIGLKEVERIQGEMNKVMSQVKFSGSFKDFINYLRTDLKFYPQTAEALLKEAAFIAKKIDGKLPTMFGKLPRQPYAVVPVPDYLAPAFTTGRYSRAPITSKRSGEYWVNTFNLSSRTLYTLEALTLHEAVPGHHLQIALTQELDNLPDFRKNLYINAFGEGWGLYSEYLGHEMGFYKDPYSLFGRLTYDMWRACRLVIDVGIHTKEWSREKAVAYLADHTALSLYEVNTEINRYISWPGQALAYKIGEIKIKEMRKKAELALKEKFDVRAFHDMVLSNGTVTLSILEKMTNRFIEQQMQIKK